MVPSISLQLQGNLRVFKSKRNSTVSSTTQALDKPDKLRGFKAAVMGRPAPHSAGHQANERSCQVPRLQQ